MTTTMQKMLFLLSGWVIWSSCLGVLYTVVYIGCEHTTVPADRLSSLNAILAALWFAHLMVLIWIARRSWRIWQAEKKQDQSADVFVPAVTWLANVSALAGTVWLGFPVLVTPPCPLY